MHLSTLIVAAAVGVSAHPSGHHAHRSLHSKKNVAARAEPAMITATINGKVVSWANPGSPFKQNVKSEAKAETPAPSKTTSAAAATSTADSNKGSSGSSGTGKGATSFEGFCKGSKRSVDEAVGVSKREDYSQTTKENIAYAGNVGSCGYGSNFKLVASESAMNGYKYGIKVTGGGKQLVCGAYNKISASGGIDGFWVKNHAVSFTVPANAEQWIAVDSNTQGGVMCTHEDKIPERPSDGYPLVTWAEIDFGSTPNKGFSGWDASGIPPSKGGVACNSLKFCAIKLPNGMSLAADKKCSDVAAGTSCAATNAYGPADEWVGGLGSSLGVFGDNDGSFFLHADYS